MNETKNDKKTIWLYAVILFTSAFIVLLLTAFSQIKFNRNISEFKNQLSSESKEKVHFQTNLNSALDENKKLKDEIKNLKEDISISNLATAEKSKEIAKLTEKNSSLDIYEILITADNEYKNGNMIACAEILSKQVKPEVLSTFGKERYNFLVENSYKKAALDLYNQGYDFYRKKQYSEAEKKFTQSLFYEAKEYFSDDSLYFMAYAEYWLNNKTDSISNFQRLLTEYPQSNYTSDALNMLKNLGNN